MIDELKKEAIIYEVIRGDVTKVMVDGKIFVPEQKEFTQKEKPILITNKNLVPHKIIEPALDFKSDIKENIKEIPEIKEKTRGKRIDYVSGCTIHENPLRDMKNAIEKNLSQEEMLSILRCYYPNVKDKPEGLSALYVYLRGYIRYINGKAKVITYKKTKPKSKKKRRKRRIIPEGAVGWCEKYQTNIWQDEYNKVSKALNHIEYRYKPSTAQIAEKAKMTIHRVRAVLSFMLDVKENITYINDESGVRIYRFKNR